MDMNIWLGVEGSAMENQCRVEGEGGNRPYETPQLMRWGKVSDITQNGCTNPGGDAKGGSVLGLPDQAGSGQGQCNF